MQRPILLLLLLFSHLTTIIYADEENSPGDLLAELNGAPSGIVNGSVHVITGRYCDTAVDVRMAGASRLTFERSRIGRFFAGWNTNHQGTFAIDYKSSRDSKKKKERYHFIYSGAHGQSHVFSYKAKNLSKVPGRIEFTQEMAEKGITNISSGYVSGQTNIKNDHINYDYNRNRAKFVNARGEIHYFENTYTKRLNNLVKIVFPSTVQWHYKYTEHDDLCKISAINGHWEPCGWITFERKYEPKQHKHAPTATVRSSDGQVVNYTIKDVARKKNEFSPNIIRVEGSHIPTIRYEYEHCMLTKRKYPNGRYLGTEYYRRGTHKNGKRTIQVSKKTAFKNRVAYQTAPVGADKTPVVTHRYFYDIQDKKAGKGKTEVVDAYNRLTVYDYNNNRLDTITYYNEDNTPEKADKFYWGSNENTGNIICRSIENGAGEPLICRTYQYDHKGNVLEDRLYGNLTGTCTVPIDIDKNGTVKNNGVESYVKNYTYITNRYNLVESEWDGKTRITYSYRPNSNLMESKLTWVADSIIQREFFEYDRFGCITRQVIDDGNRHDKNDLNGVTERHITEYHQDNSPVVGLPGQVVNKVWNPLTGAEELAGKVAYSYTQEGWVTEERQFDSQDNCVASTTYAHDRFGNVIHKVDPLGYTTSWQYDENGNMTHEQGPRQDVRKEYRYDYSNRLVAEEEIHSNGLRLKHSFRYDHLGNKCQEVDIYGNVTHYGYDRFCRRIHSIGPDGTTLEAQTYNPLNQAISKSDACGNQSQYSYNIRGAPAEVVYPDGTKETCIYNLDGTLKQKTERDGKTTVYTYDSLDRQLTADVYDTAGNHLYQTTKEYNTFHLVKETDPEGYVTTYDYDYHGRLVKTVKGDRVQELSYDTLGRRSQMIERVSDNEGIITEYEYDALDRITETTIKNMAGEVQSWELCRYDHDGNKLSVATEIQGKVSITQTEYNARGKVVKRVDPEGRETHIEYKYDYFNEEGVCVSYREETDPTGKKTLFIGDLYGRDKKIILLDPYGKTLHVTHFSYDNTGNKLEKVDEVYVRGKHVRNFVCKWRYDASGRPIEQFEAYGTPIQKETHITYNEKGKKSSVTKPDGVVVTYQYGENGLLDRVVSSDQSIDYQYAYDIKGNPTIVTDHVNGTHTERVYDRYSQVVHEKQGNGLSIDTEYDPLGRVKAIHHPDGVRVDYEYDGMNLKKIMRSDCQGNELYSHEYLDYDRSGKVVESSLAGKAETIRYEYDLLGRVTAIQSDHWQEVVGQYDEGGNMLGKEVVDQLGKCSDCYQYDTLNQLTKEEGTVEHVYENDSLHNRVGKDGTDHEVNALNQIISDGNKHYRYDPNGNIVSIEELGNKMLFTYDAFDRLIEVDNNGTITRYHYDEHHRRLGKGADQYLYHDRNEVLAVNAEGTIHQRRILGVGLGGEIGAAVMMEFGERLYVPVHDHNGNVTTLVDGESGEVTECYRYTAFGEEVTDNQGSINPWRFSSKRVDDETGLVFFGRRYYIPEVGRWLTADPLGDYDGSNLYAYVKNRPLTHFDIYGLLAHYAGYDVSRGVAPVKDLGRCISWYGGTMESLSKHCTPPSPIRWLAETGFRALQGKWPTKPSWQVESIFETVGEKPCPPGIAMFYAHGIGTEYPKALEQARSMSNMAGGYQVQLISHPTRGILTDLLNCAMEKCNFPVNHIKLSTDKYLETYSRLENECSDHPMIFIAGHSRGGMETYHSTKHLPKGIRDCMHVITLGSASMVSDKNYSRGHNYVNPRDQVPRTDLLGMFMNKSSITYTTYQGDSALWIDDHSFDNPGYQQPLGLELKLFKKNDRWKQ